MPRIMFSGTEKENVEFDLKISEYMQAMYIIYIKQQFSSKETAATILQVDTATLYETVCSVWRSRFCISIRS